MELFIILFALPATIIFESIGYLIIGESLMQFLEKKYKIDNMAVLFIYAMIDLIILFCLVKFKIIST